MAVAVLPYDVHNFNATPQLPEALAKHQETGGDLKIQEKFGALFERHGVEKLLGISLIHHHFDLDDGEYLTEVSGTSTAWKSKTGTVPHVWAIDTEVQALRPLEFVMQGDDDGSPIIDWNGSKLQSFLHALIKIIKDTNADGIYGLATYPGDDFPGRVEMTIDRANINLTPKQAAKYEPGYQSQAAWFFDGGIIKHGCKCNCFHHGTKNSKHEHINTMQT